MKQKEILSYFNLESHPFDKEIKTDALMELPTIENAAEKLSLLIETKGIGLLTGPSGCGKSTLIRKTAADLNPGLYKPFYVSHTSLGTAEFYQSFAAALELSSQGRRSTVFRRIKEFMLSSNDQKRIHPVVFIDEAHHLSSDTLKEIRMLTNFEYDSKNACTVVLSGHPELRQKLNLNVFTSLANSITYSIRLDALSAEETFSYLEGRISVNGGSPALFTKNAMNLIHDFSGGILRTMGTAAWLSMVKAFIHKSTQVEKEHVQMVLEN